MISLRYPKIFSNLTLFSVCVALLCSLLWSEPADAAVVLQYHHIGDETPPITSTSIEAFEAHLDYLAASDRVVVPLTDIVEKPHIADDRRVAITFDDAYSNIFELAVPKLVARNWPFTVFVATEYIGVKGYFSWDDLRYIEENGGLVANHTHSHLHMLRKLDGESDDAWLERLRLDIEKAQSLLENHLSHPARYFAYPYGEYNLEILRLIEELGYVGFVQQSGAVGETSVPTLLPRFPLSGIYQDLETFKTKASTSALPIEVPIISPLIEQNPPELNLQFKSSKDLRLDQLVCYGPGGKTTLTRKSELTFSAINETPVPVGRSRYNCTMPTGDGNFYWFSQLWIRKKPDGSWYPEP